jgi:hypothetical protein
MTDKEFVKSIYPDADIFETDRIGKVSLSGCEFRTFPNAKLILTYDAYWEYNHTIPRALGVGKSDIIVWKNALTIIKNSLMEKLQS